MIISNSSNEKKYARIYYLRFNRFGFIGGVTYKRERESFSTVLILRYKLPTSKWVSEIQEECALPSEARWSSANVNDENVTPIYKTAPFIKPSKQGFKASFFNAVDVHFSVNHHLLKHCCAIRCTKSHQFDSYLFFVQKSSKYLLFS